MASAISWWISLKMWSSHRRAVKARHTLTVGCHHVFFCPRSHIFHHCQSTSVESVGVPGGADYTSSTHFQQNLRKKT